MATTSEQVSDVVRGCLCCKAKGDPSFSNTTWFSTSSFRKHTQIARVLTLQIPSVTGLRQRAMICRCMSAGVDVRRPRTLSSASFAGGKKESCLNSSSAGLWHPGTTFSIPTGLVHTSSRTRVFVYCFFEGCSLLWDADDVVTASRRKQRKRQRRVSFQATKKCDEPQMSLRQPKIE